MGPAASKVQLQLVHRTGPLSSTHVWDTPQAGQVTSFGISAADSHASRVLVVADQERLLQTASVEEYPDSAVEELVHEKKDVGAGAGHTNGETGCSELGRHIHEVDATQAAHEHLVTSDRVAGTAVGGTVDAVLVVVFLAAIVAANRANATISRTAHAVLRARARPITTPVAGSAVGGAGETILTLSVAPMVATSRADTAIRRAGRAVLTQLGLAKAVTARIAVAAVFGAGHARLGGVAGPIAARIAEAAVRWTGRAGLRVRAASIAASVAEAAIFGASSAVLAGVAVAIAAARAAAAVLGAGEAIFAATGAVATGVAEAAILGAGSTAFVTATGAVGAPCAGTAISRTAQAVLPRRAGPVPATSALAAVAWTGLARLSGGAAPVSATRRHIG